MEKPRIRGDATRPATPQTIGTGRLRKPRFKGKQMAHINLRQLQVGQRATIITVNAKGEINQRIRDMGIIPGSSVQVVGRAPLRDPVAVRISGVTISLRNKEADCVVVEI